MFYIKDFTEKIHLNPSFLGPNIQSMVKEYLYTHVEGTCGRDGYVITVLKIDEISEGKITLSGTIIFTIKYTALTLLPYKGEIIDANVVETNKMGVFASAGPLSIFISNYQIPNGFNDEIVKDSMLRLKIIGTKVDSSKIYAVGTLNDDCLGIIRHM